MSTKKEPVTVGIINQMYEDRRTRRTGKLLERNERFKTLLMESPDGSTFNITFAQFKSNWRKVQVEESAESVVETPIAEVPEEKVESVEIEHKSQESVDDFYAETVKIVANALSESEKVGVSLSLVPAKAEFCVKANNRIIFEVYSKKRLKVHKILMKETTYLGIKDFYTFSNVVDNPNNVRNIVATLEDADVETFFSGINKYLIDVVCSMNAKEE